MNSIQNNSSNVNLFSREEGDISKLTKKVEQELNETNEKLRMGIIRYTIDQSLVSRQLKRISDCSENIQALQKQASFLKSLQADLPLSNSTKKQKTSSNFQFHSPSSSSPSSSSALSSATVSLISPSSSSSSSSSALSSATVSLISPSSSSSSSSSALPPVADQSVDFSTSSTIKYSRARSMETSKILTPIQKIVLQSFKEGDQLLYKGNKTTFKHWSEESGLQIVNKKNQVISVENVSSIVYFPSKSVEFLTKYDHHKEEYYVATVKEDATTKLKGGKSVVTIQNIRWDSGEVSYRMSKHQLESYIPIHNRAFLKSLESSTTNILKRDENGYETGEKVRAYYLEYKKTINLED